MSEQESTNAFQTMVKHYEADGWEVRTINHQELRATVRARGASAGDVARELTIQVIATESGCRKLWVDSKGQVQETNVPC